MEPSPDQTVAANQLGFVARGFLETLMGEMIDNYTRPAQYYPYIHIRSEQWLKATLLFAPTVKRIVPDNYTPEDESRITPYTQIVGPNGALLQAVPADSPAAFAAQDRLLEKLREHETEIHRTYNRKQAPTRDAYWIHVAKFQERLLAYLRSRDLAWSSNHSRAYGNRTWFAMHPRLGSAIMTTLGLSIAREQRYDIVTPSIRLHETLLANEEEKIFEAVLRNREDRYAQAPQVRHDLLHLVIDLTGVNYEALRPEDIPELQASSSFAKFQRLIRIIAKSIDPDADPRDYRSQLRDEAHAIVDAWRSTTKAVGRAVGFSLFESAAEVSPEMTVVLTKNSDVLPLFVAGGVAIFTAGLKGLRAWKEQRQGPYQYLTKIFKAQNKSIRLMLPLGLER